MNISGRGPADVILFSLPMWLRMPARHVVSFGWTGTVDVWLCKPLARFPPSTLHRSPFPIFASPPQERAYLGNYRVPACCTFVLCILSGVQGNEYAHVLTAAYVSFLRGAKITTPADEKKA